MTSRSASRRSCCGSRATCRSPSAAPGPSRGPGSSPGGVARSRRGGTVTRCRTSESPAAPRSTVTAVPPGGEEPEPAGPRRSAPAGARAATGSARSSPRSTTSPGGRLGAAGAAVVSHVFPRVVTRALPMAVHAEGVWITAADGTRYLDGAGGAIVVNVGHGVPEVIEAIERQLRATQYVHGTMFTTEALESYADELAPLLPMDDPHLYPVSGGSEAVETALKMARSYHLARGESARVAVIGRRSATTATRSGRSTRAARSRSASRTRPGSGGSRTCRRPTSTAAGTPPTPRRAAPGTRGAGARDLPVGRGRGGRVHRRTGGRRHARRRGPVRRLPGRRGRGLPALRRPRDRRRGR